MAALNELFRIARHIVAQIIEAKLVVGSVGDICPVCIAARRRVGLMPVDAINGEPMELIQWTHPLAVTTGEVVIDSYKMYTAARERIQKSGECRNQRLS